MMAAHALAFNGRNCVSSDERASSLDTKMLELLLGKGADPNHCSANGLTALMITAKRGRFDAVRLLIRHKANAGHEAEGGLDALILATLFADRSTIQILLKNGASVNTYTKDGITPLFLAVEKREYEMVKMLVDEGACLYPGRNMFLNPIIMAAKHGRSNLIEMFMARERDEANEGDKEDILFNALFMASKNGHFDTVDVFLRLRVVNINCSNSIGCTPLMIASENGHIRTVELLLSYGAYVHALNNKGVSAAGKAVENGHEDIAQMLEKYVFNITPKAEKYPCYDFTSLLVKNPSDSDSVYTGSTISSQSGTLSEGATSSQVHTTTSHGLEDMIYSVPRKCSYLGKASGVVPPPQKQTMW
ncbi:unnamed protein product [Lymnaea stagnalis]|uniref:Ankyrin repeat protein n=1 Tax=Lymnaea stagnalis TaxID=6523 RepID=A0AAV2IJ92_LYMST